MLFAGWRAKDLSMVYQNPGQALNPSIRVGDQVAEVFRIGGAQHADALGRAEQALRKVQIADPRSVMRRYPHQLSGGMPAARRDCDGARQRSGPADSRRADDRALTRPSRRRCST